MNIRDNPMSPKWDQQNNVEIRYFKGDDELDHSGDRPYEFRIKSEEPMSLDLVGLYDAKTATTLIVSFHGSLQRSKYRLPRFEWRKTLSTINAARLYIADSSLEQSNGMALAWYVGNSTQDLTAEIAKLISRIMAEGGYERVILTGSSGGGFASLAVSRRILGSVVVCFSPQTRVGDYDRSVVGTFRKVCFPDYDGYDSLEIDYENRVNLRALYRSTADVNFVRFIQNTNDESHFVRHYEPFVQQRGVDPAVGGFDVSGRFEFLPQALQQGHQPPSKGRFRNHLIEAHRSFFGEDLVLDTGRQ